MSLAHVFTRAQVGIETPQVTVEVYLGSGLPAFNIVGLPETSVKEAKDRVRSALENSHFAFPSQRITVNLAPADLPKEGGRYDLAIAIGILIASGQLTVSQPLACEFLAELGLDGKLRPVRGVLPAMMAVRNAQRTAYLSSENEREAELVADAQCKCANSLHQVWLDLNNQQSLPLLLPQSEMVNASPELPVDFSEVKGQELAKRVLEIAAAGGHNVLFTGPPGTGKSMLAQRMATIMPRMTTDQALQTAAVYSVSGHDIDLASWRQRPFRSPHHTCSAVALVGGSSKPKPGEISLAHNGVLFLDELPEFERKVIDSLREPMETGVVTISRAAIQVEFPARFQLIAALNPSPTGHHTDKRANPEQVLRYLSRISGPFVDRIDLQIELSRIPSTELLKDSKQESSATVRKRVEQAYEFQLQRQGVVNALLSNKELSQHCRLDAKSHEYLALASERLQLSPRSHHRVIKVARTIADLNAMANIQVEHIKEALSYRAFERLLARLGE
ncbi:ATP-dependent protease [Pseudoalteromonas sp. CO325X]|uniref:YifB family Mg chelatase-like AAA ATPase n=1 Tax=Pseudoalteromonas sp. CO325X TaxID=1777262 RepID=UPI001023C750|nr:YifB family Mg chelatase-like AAA ATPase [Pseudoalteromonas sp. CO325X]RZF79023.1 ATP-dependent protease [Pseudoalteromonas sp. CO325X]